VTSKSDYYRAKTNVTLPYRGAYVVLTEGEIVPKGSPLLKAIGPAAVAEHFEEVTSFGRWDVEQATAAPGEKRGTKTPTTHSPKDTPTHGGKG
jgi:hypothetical protein